MAFYMGPVRRQFQADPPAAREKVESAARYSVELTTTFSIQPVEKREDDTAPLPFVLRLSGRDMLITPPKEIRPGVPVVVSLPVLDVGKNELVLDAKAVESDRNHVLRLRILRDGIVVGDEATFWFKPDRPIRVIHRFTVQEAGDRHEHP
jgi:hypothetical protein